MRKNRSKAQLFIAGIKYTVSGATFPRQRDQRKTSALCQGILFKEPNPYTGSRPRDIIGLYRKHKTLNPNPTARQPNSRHQVAGRRPDLPGARDGGGGVVSGTRPGAAPWRKRGGGVAANGEHARGEGRRGREVETAVEPGAVQLSRLSRLYL
jgi:hypothetical protein